MPELGITQNKLKLNNDHNECDCCYDIEYSYKVQVESLFQEDTEEIDKNKDKVKDDGENEDLYFFKSEL